MIYIKSEHDIEQMRKGGEILAQVLESIISLVKPGVSTEKLNEAAERAILKAHCQPAFKGYRQRLSDPAYPAVLCTSVNDEVVHAIPRKNRMLLEGDIIGLDIGLIYPGKERGYYLDMAKTVGVGRISAEATQLLERTLAALSAGISVMKPGVWLSVVSSHIEAVLKQAGLGIVRDLAGHGVGYALHEEPEVLNYCPKTGYHDIQLQAGMVLALEPMATSGGWKVFVDHDGWTVKTHDGSLAAQFEHTIAVTSDGYEILTQNLSKS